MNQLRSARLNLSIVLPCYNPKPGWHIDIANRYLELKAALPPNTLVELIVVNDGSNQKVSTASRRFLSRRCANFRYIHYQQNRGKGYAVRKGVEAASSPYIIYTDADFPYTVADICKVYDMLLKGNAEVVMGTREANYGRQLSLLRRTASNACNYLNTRVLNLPHRDVQSGLKGINAVGREILLKTRINRFLFDTEFIWLANSYSNIRIAAIPVNLRKDVSFTSMSSAIYINEAGNFLRILLKDTLLVLRRFDAEYKTAIPRTA